MAIKRRKIILTTDASGSASETIFMPSKLHTIKIDYASDVSSGCDTTIKNDLGETVYSKTDSNTDVIVSPRKLVQDNTGADISGEYDYYTGNHWTITIAQGGASKIINMTLMFEV